MCAFRNDPGVFVTEVTPGGVADREGSIKRGDQILAINGKDIKIAGQEVAAQLVKVGVDIYFNFCDIIIVIVWS